MISNEVKSMSCFVMSRGVKWSEVTSSEVMSCNLITYHVKSFQVMSSHFTSFDFMSC